MMQQAKLLDKINNNKTKLKIKKIQKQNNMYQSTAVHQ